MHACMNDIDYYLGLLESTILIFNEYWGLNCSLHISFIKVCNDADHWPCKNMFCGFDLHIWLSSVTFTISKPPRSSFQIGYACFRWIFESIKITWIVMALLFLSCVLRNRYRQQFHHVEGLWELMFGTFCKIDVSRPGLKKHFQQQRMLMPGLVCCDVLFNKLFPGKNAVVW